MYSDYSVGVLVLQHGESVCNLYGRIGGNSELSQRGWEVSGLVSERVS